MSEINGLRAENIFFSNYKFLIFDRTFVYLYGIVAIGLCFVYKKVLDSLIFRVHKTPYVIPEMPAQIKAKWGNTFGSHGLQKIP